MFETTLGNIYTTVLHNLITDGILTFFYVNFLKLKISHVGQLYLQYGKQKLTPISKLLKRR